MIFILFLDAIKIHYFGLIFHNNKIFQEASLITKYYYCIYFLSIVKDRRGEKNIRAAENITYNFLNKFHSDLQITSHNIFLLNEYLVMKPICLVS